MNKFVRLLCAGVVVPAAFAITFYQSSVSGAVNQQEEKISRPYIVDVIETNGEISAELKGLSDSSDPFVIAQNLGAEPNIEDKFSAFPEIKMGIGSKITLYRAPTFTIIDGKKKQVVRSWQKTVGDLIVEKNLPEIGLDDRINFATDVELEDKMEIRIIRVAITTVIDKQPIQYQTVKKEDKTLDEGKTRVETAGVKGVKSLYYQVRREDGVEIARTLQKTEVTTVPVNEILIIGTKPVITVRCKYNETALTAGVQYNIKPNDLCYRMMKESNGNPSSDGGKYKGLFQYEEGLWSSVSAKAGYSGASIWDAKAQIYVTAWAWSHGYRGRWPSP